MSTLFMHGRAPCISSFAARRRAFSGQNICSPSLPCSSLHSLQHRACHTPTATTSTNGVVAAEVSSQPAPAAVSNVDELKQRLLSELAGLDRGIGGVPAAKKVAVLSLVAELENHNLVKEPTTCLDRVAGDWKLLYSTITITGKNRTKLGLREFIKLGDFIQSIDTDSNIATNTVQFSVTGLGAIKGDLTIRAQYKVASGQRVNITYLDSALRPSQLQKIFEQNLDLLLSIFNPEGHLDITYLDDSWRVGRDDKGNVFLLERA